MIRGEAVGLRAIERADLPTLLDWRNRPAFRRHFREYRELGLDHQAQWFDTIALRDERTRMFAVVEPAANLLLGACGLCAIDWLNRTADFSIYIGQDGLYIDERFAPDAGRTLLRYGFEELGMHRIWCEIYDFDTAKRRLLAALGFTLDGRHREAHWGEGGWHDSLFFGILDREFAARVATAERVA
ncbi:MAG TPA: GNAT family protein [Stellaceae bacterium]|nr:GNAT family protein [Stellaceae bacterium]